MEKKEKLCFIISPIGQPKTDIRKHADDVLECIITPALEKYGIKGVRADHMGEPGKISDQMIGAILDYDLCIADLTGNNPNVFYEVAIAQAARKPIVLIMHQGEKIPFDIQDYRILEYDLEPRNIYHQKWANLLAGQIQAVLSKDYQPVGLVAKGSFLKGNQDHHYWINRTSKEFGEAPQFLDVVEKTEKRCDLQGISLKSWAKKDAKKLLLKKAEQNCRIRILIMHEENPTLPGIINEDLPGQSLTTIKEQLRDMVDYFNELAGQSDCIQVKQIKKGVPNFQLILTDQNALCLQYLYSRQGNESPLLQYPAGSPLYGVLADEFETIWDLND